MNVNSSYRTSFHEHHFPGDREPSCLNPDDIDAGQDSRAGPVLPSQTTLCHPASSALQEDSDPLAQGIVDLQRTSDGLGSPKPMVVSGLKGFGWLGSKVNRRGAVMKAEFSSGYSTPSHTVMNPVFLLS